MTRLRTLTWCELSDDGRRAALRRPPSSLDPGLLADVRNIVDTVRREKDAAVRRLTATFDKVDLATPRIELDEARAAWESLAPSQRDPLTRARRNIARFHEAQQRTPETIVVEPGVECRQEFRPIDAVGLYVPGGTAPLPSAVLMLAVPAAIAGCRRRVVCTPPQGDGRPAPSVLAAAWLCEATEIYAIGGAQAIAAMAWGTDALPEVDKIFGPGNAFVTAAKMLASQDPLGAACDLPAGPSEVLVIADDSADPDAVAADLLAQAEHGTDSQALLFTDSPSLAAQVVDAVGVQLPARQRRDIIRASLASSACIVFDTLDEAVAASNTYAPEHLILNLRDARERVAQIESAGSIFVGPWAAETFGDYCSGTNHVLPTYGFATAYSGVSLASFQKAITVQELSAQGFDALADTAETLAEMEGLDAHAAAVGVRRSRRRQQGAA